MSHNRDFFGRATSLAVIILEEPREKHVGTRMNTDQIRLVGALAV
jgi:hypothetical protein